MNNSFTVESPSVPSREAIADYAREIKKLAVRLRGNKELGYIRQDTPAAVFAGKTVDEAMEIGKANPEAQSSAQADAAPYIMDDSNPDKPRYKGTPDHWKAVEDELNWIEKRWAEALGPEPKEFDGAIGDFATSAKALYDQSTGIESTGTAWNAANSAIDSWDSNAATSFRNNMWFRMPNIIRRQASVATVMAHGLAATRDTWVEHRRSLEDIAKKTIAALNAVKVGQADNTKANLSILAGIVTIATGVVTIPLTGGATTAAIAAGLTIVAGAATTAGGAISLQDDKRKDVELGAPTVSGVLAFMGSALGDAAAHATSNERDICDGLQAVHDYITNTSGKESESSDIKAEDLPEGVKPGQLGEQTYSPRQKLVLPRPSLIDSAGGLPAPPVTT